MNLTRVAADDGGVALGTALSLADAKHHLNALHDTDDALITALCHVARAHMEGDDGTGGRLGRAVTRHVIDAEIEAFPSGRADLRLPQPPLISVAWVKYYDADDVLQTLATTAYHVVRDAVSPFIRLAAAASWPSTAERPDAVQVRFTCGPETVPVDLAHALKLHVGHLYINREAALEKSLVSLPLGYDALCGPHRTHGWV